MHKMKKLFLLMVLLTATLDSSAMQPANAQVKIGLFSSGLIPLLHYLCEHPEYDDIVLQHLHKTTQPVTAISSPRAKPHGPNTGRATYPARYIRAIRVCRD